MTLELPLIFLGGLLGSSHCVGMCGGFALTIGLGARSAGGNVARQLLFASGRLFTYAFLGAAAGFAGSWFARRSGSLVGLQAALSLLAGTLLTFQGLKSLGLLPTRVWTKLARHNPTPACLAGTFAAGFLSSSRRIDVFLAGVFNGLLPCGLVYGYLSLATSSASLVTGPATMVAFGLGTVPAMVLTGVGASLLPLAARRRVFQAAAVCVLATGLLAAARGVAFLGGDGTSETHCPACARSV